MLFKSIQKKYLMLFFIENVKYDIYWLKIVMLSCPIIQILSAEFLKNAYNLKNDVGLCLKTVSSLSHFKLTSQAWKSKKISTNVI